MEQIDEFSPRLFSQYAQDPFAGFQEDEEDDSALSKKIKKASQKPKNSKKRDKIENKITKKSTPGQPPSFVINNKPGKGSRLIKIKMINLNAPGYVEDNDDGESVLLNAQYVADDGYDEIVDSAEGLINKISKKLCGYSVSF